MGYHGQKKAGDIGKNQSGRLEEGMRRREEKRGRGEEGKRVKKGRGEKDR